MNRWIAASAETVVQAAPLLARSLDADLCSAHAPATELRRRHEAVGKVVDLLRHIQHGHLGLAVGATHRVVYCLFF